MRNDEKGEGRHAPSGVKSTYLEKSKPSPMEQGATKTWAGVLSLVGSGERKMIEKKEIRGGTGKWKLDLAGEAEDGKEVILN